MSSTFRPRAAAAALALASLGAVYVAPASANLVFRGHGQTTAALERFEMHGVLEPGQGIVFRVYGTPGGQARVHVPGVRDMLLSEVQPGMYEGRYSIGRYENPGALRAAVATLQAAGGEATARLGGSATNLDNRGPFGSRNDRWDGRDARRDNRGPEIASVSPGNGDRVNDRGRTRVTAQFNDQGSGIDRGSVRLRIDGRDVTGSSRVGNDAIEYRDDLAPGRHVAELSVRDRAGNVTRRTWSFDVVDPDRRYGWNDGRRW